MEEDNSGMLENLLRNMYKTGKILERWLTSAFVSVPKSNTTTKYNKFHIKVSFGIIKVICEHYLQ